MQRLGDGALLLLQLPPCSSAEEVGVGRELSSSTPPLSELLAALRASPCKAAPRLVSRAFFPFRRRTRPMSSSRQHNWREIKKIESLLRRLSLNRESFFAFFNLCQPLPTSFFSSSIGPPSFVDAASSPSPWFLHSFLLFAPNTMATTPPPPQLQQQHDLTARMAPFLDRRPAASTTTPRSRTPRSHCSRRPTWSTTPPTCGGPRGARSRPRSLPPSARRWWPSSRACR